MVASVHMVSQQSSREGSERFNELVQAGRAALNMGNRQQAHDYWKEAARLNPFHEQIWQMLLDVVDSEEDRRVCLQNILQINPLNTQARRQINQMQARKERAAQYRLERIEARQVGARRRRHILTRAIFLGLAIGLSGAFFGVVLSILLYGR
ncbi:MAG: hypothetical protein JNM70_02315 [Anaerolineae bacterium]|nr:hypothetical protein [Anaerolineae bacterium]